MNYQEFFQAKINELKQEKRYRYFATIERNKGNFPYATHHSEKGEKQVVVWCSNDYLGMGQHPKVEAAVEEAIHRCGAGSGGTRNISGTTIYHAALEKELADLHHKDSALIFSSGYVANEAILATLGKMLPECVMLSDEYNHASMIQGIRHGGAKKLIFKHNDVHHLKQLLSEIPLETPKVVAFESVYSMDGDIAPLHDFLELCEKYNALSYVDEVHGVGMYGDRGAGIIEKEGLNGRFSIVQGTFGKAYGLMGGYMAASSVLVDFIRSYASGFIFTTSLPPILVAGILASVRHLKNSQEERVRHQERVYQVKTKLKKARIPFIDTTSHIIPVIVGDPEFCQQASKILLEQFHVYVQPINYPTVPRGTERFRVTPSPFHTDEMIDQFIDGLSYVWQLFSLKHAAA